MDPEDREFWWQYVGAQVVVAILAVALWSVLWSILG